MTHIFHLGFLGRKVNQFGDTITYTDDRPPPTQEELDATHNDAQAEWDRQQNPPKSWPDVGAFISEFTMDEMAQIGLSTDPTIAALRFLLSGWFSQVLSDDPRVVQGLTTLVNLHIISDERRTEILS
jgi:hypothetical protein